MPCRSVGDARLRNTAAHDERGACRARLGVVTGHSGAPSKSQKDFDRWADTLLTNARGPR